MGAECVVVVFFTSFAVRRIKRLVIRGYKFYCIPIFNTENNLYSIFKISASGFFIKRPLISASIKHVPIYKRVFTSHTLKTDLGTRQELTELDSSFIIDGLNFLHSAVTPRCARSKTVQ